MKDINKSIQIIFILLLLCFLAIGVNLTWRQLVRGRYYVRKDYHDYTFQNELPRLIERGVLFSDGDYFAKINEEKLKNYILTKANPDNPEEYDYKGHPLYRQLTRFDRMGVLQVEDGKISLSESATLIRNPRSLRRERYAVRGRILDRQYRPLAYSEVHKKGNATRKYPYGQIFSSLVGYTGIAYGSSGFERIYADYLLGKQERSIFQKLFHRGHTDRIGGDVVLTLDCELQQAAYDALGKHSGAVIVLDVQTGEVLAMVSKPTFDTNQPPGKEWARAFRDKEKQVFLNRAIQELYPPGSTFKALVTAAALELGTVDPKEKLLCKGISKYRIRDHSAHGNVDLHEALVVSCNVYFSELAVKLGASPLREYAKRFGFEREVDLIPDEDSKHLFAVASRSVSPKITERDKGLLAQSGIGQHEVRATPLQMAMVASAIATGKLMNPYIVKEIRYGKKETGNEGQSETPKLGDRIKEYKPKMLGDAIPRDVAKGVREMMIDVLKRGTGKRLKKIYRTNDGAYVASQKRLDAEQVLVAGKTGTAETGIKGIRAHSWFIAFAPALKPRVALCVIAERAGWGATVAGPITIEVLAKALNVVEGR